MDRSSRRPLHLAGAVVHLCLAGFFLFVFYARYWAWRHEIAQVNTSFLTPDGNNVTTGGMIWLLPALYFTALGLFHVARYVLPGSRLPADD